MTIYSSVYDYPVYRGYYDETDPSDVYGYEDYDDDYCGDVGGYEED